MKKQTDLKFLLSVKWNGHNHAWLKKSRVIVNAVKKYSQKKTQKQIAQALGMSTAVLVMHLTELRKVASAGLTLEQYAEAGRKFAPGNKVIAIRGKRKEK